MKEKKLMNKLHNSVDYSNLKFKYADQKNNDVNFYEYKDSRELLM